MSGKRVRKNPEKERDSSRNPYTFRENILTAMQVPGDLACKGPHHHPHSGLFQGCDRKL